jgi:hypothetical protein
MKQFLPKNWQQIVAALITATVMAVLGHYTGQVINPPPIPTPEFDATAYAMGWVADPDAVAEVAAQQPFQAFRDTPAFRDTKDEADAFLFQAFEKATGAIPPARNQGQVGSCVSFGTCAAVDCLIAIAFTQGATGEYHDTVQEAVYGGSRVQIGGGRIRGDGSIGAWAAEWVRTRGAIARGKVGNYDLSTYSESRCRAWGNSGCPKDLEPTAKEHPVQGITQVKSAEEAKRALINGYPIACCSNQGFSSTRDADGFARAQGNWGHCMAWLGYRADKKAFFVWNSWGNSWITGPKGPGNPPEGGFWCSWEVADRMAKQGDTWAFSDVKGWGARKIDWFVRAAPRWRDQEPRIALRGYDHAFSSN